MASVSSLSTVPIPHNGSEEMQQSESESFAASSIVTVLVGPNRVPYFAHKETLINNCPFFAKCLDSGMKEEHTNEVEFPDDTCLAFDLFFLWIYHREVPRAENHDEVLEAMSAWVLGDKFCMTGWQNSLIDSIMSFWKETPMAPGHLAWLYANAEQSSLLFDLGWDELIWRLAFSSSVYLFDEQLAAELEDLILNPACSVILLLRSVYSEKANDSDHPAENTSTYQIRSNEKT